MNKDIREGLFKSLWRKKELEIAKNEKKSDTNINRKEE